MPGKTASGVTKAIGVNRLVLLSAILGLWRRFGNQKVFCILCERYVCFHGIKYMDKVRYYRFGYGIIGEQDGNKSAPAFFVHLAI